VRRLERRWKLTNLTIDKQIMHGELRNLHEMINLAKRSFLESQILEAGGKKTPLFKLVDSLLLVQPGLWLPAHDSLTELVEQFSHFLSPRSTISERTLTLLLDTGNRSHNNPLSPTHPLQ
jgi:hypothetical protein